MNESKNDIRTSDNGDNIVMHDRGEDNILNVMTATSNDSDPMKTVLDHVICLVAAETDRTVEPFQNEICLRKSFNNLLQSLV